MALRLKYTFSTRMPYFFYAVISFVLIYFVLQNPFEEFDVVFAVQLTFRIFDNLNTLQSNKNDHV